ncbi:putative disease resistance protein RGA3 [Beta vulgaris subsp. vulgaris]|uniref:putative disease resistance protein RGA3 n=1 Tax=Beta vulgaris subsp. vulgaris TaxID=3555 RepID=UPI00203747D1|nr:putative disease resistance protein RGA3 [Beta vulgaris subsp. vulgaris]
MSDPVSLLAGPIITKIVDLAVAFGKNKYDQIYGVEGEIEKLTSNLSSIASVLRDAERCCSDSKSEQLADWLTKLRDAALDVEDILETYATEVAMREKQKNLVSVSWLSSRSDAANKIKKIVARIDIISQEKAKFHFRPEDYGGTEWKPQPTRIGLREMSFLRDTTDIVGREEEQEEVVSWLLSEEESDSNGRVPVLPIIGMGGLGKTTLAQLVYNDERVYNKKNEACHFKVAIWVNVSVDSSFDRILKEMVEILTEMRHDMIPRSSIQSRILEVLDGKHFLLVLDDVWVEKLDWEPLQEFLNLCPKGSKILVTSRNGNVGKIMGAICTHTLGHLSEERCWDLFKKRVFLGESYSKDLEKIGREIIRRCNFLPLAVKAMASLLRGIDDITKWQRILRNGIWESEQSNLGNGAPNILPSLKLSYDHLRPQLKQCFAFCYIFPKGYMFDKKDLVKLWIAEDYIQPSGEDKMEETGIDYFDELLTRCFFQFLNIDNKERYKMHDLMHDLAKSVSSACQQVEENKPSSIEQTSRHISFLCKDVQTPVIEMLKAKKLRTLLLPNNYPRDFGQALDKMFRAFRYMRVLDLSSSNIVDLPKSIGDLKLLRYLDLSKNEIRFLPNTICSLYNLQVLKLLGCLWLLELPKELGNLRNLRFLELDEMFLYKCSTFPPKIGGLINLHNFHSFHVRHERGYGIEELKMMNSLEGTLHISKLENSTDAKAAEMKQKEGITKLILEWSKEDVDPQDQTAQERVLEDLEPYQNLRELHIHQYKGIRFSSWMSNAMLQNLYKISLNHCLQELPHIFPNLRVMKIKQCDALKALSVMPHVMFLTLSNNALLEDWREAHMHIVQRKRGIQDVHSERYSYMALLELKIINCPRLKELPRMFSPQKLQISRSALIRTLPTPQHSQRLQCLELDKCNGSSLIESIPSTNSLYSLIISNITNLTSLPKLPHLPQLQALYIHNCQDLVSLLHPDGTLQHLTSLKLLSISGCEKLAAFPEEGLPTSIEYLSIQNCSRLQSFPTTNYLASLTSLKDLHLEDCAKLESLPADGLPPLLQHLSIQGCCPLSQECNKDEGGKYWQMISHVADLELDSIMDPAPESFIGPKKGYFACLKSK